jgi:hypothetical protein
MVQIAWNTPARLILSRNHEVYCGPLVMCVRHFRDRLSATRQVTSSIVLERDTVFGKSWLDPEEIHLIMTYEGVITETRL